MLPATKSSIGLNAQFCYYTCLYPFKKHFQCIMLDSSKCSSSYIIYGMPEVFKALCDLELKIQNPVCETHIWFSGFIPWQWKALAMTQVSGLRIWSETSSPCFSLSPVPLTAGTCGANQGMGTQSINQSINQSPLPTSLPLLPSSLPLAPSSFFPLY